MIIMKILIQKILNKVGYELQKYPNPNPDIIRRFRIINRYKINKLFDIGANCGSYAIKMRKYGYSNDIISFEPLKNAFDKLKIVSLGDSNWKIYNYAIGNSDSMGVINVAGNSCSSSILKMLPMHYKIVPESNYIDKEIIEIKKFDTIFSSFYNEEDNVMMKIDTQGYEQYVLDGANESLSRIKILQLEMSIIPLYENTMLLIETINYLENKGFQLFSFENGFSEPISGQLLQVDGIFVNKSYIN
jgi:FkbM family methyltransferase